MSGQSKMRKGKEQHLFLLKQLELLFFFFGGGEGKYPFGDWKPFVKQC